MPDEASPYLLDLHKDNPMKLVIGHNEGAASFKYFQNSWDCLCEYVNPRDKEMLRLGIGIYNRRVDTLDVINIKTLRKVLEVPRSFCC